VSFRHLWLATSMLASACAPAVDATFSDVDVVRPNIQIPPAPTSAPTSVTFSFAMSSSQLGATANPQAQDNIKSVNLHRLAFTAKGGISEMSFITNLHALACVPISKTSLEEGHDASSRQVEIADYVRTSTEAVGPTFEVPIPEPINLLPLLRPTKSEARSILVIVNLGGQMPTVGWQVDAELSLSIAIGQ
jgi:hypothetical protein